MLNLLQATGKIVTDTLFRILILFYTGFGFICFSWYSKLLNGCFLADFGRIDYFKTAQERGFTFWPIFLSDVALIAHQKLPQKLIPGILSHYFASRAIFAVMLA